MLSVPDLLERLHPDIILTVRVNGLSALHPKFDIKFKFDNTLLKCAENGNKDLVLNDFWYNWYNPDGSLTMKFHNHGHPQGTIADVIDYDPVHVQFPKDKLDVEGKIRDHSHCQTLEEVLYFIKHSFYIKNIRLE